MTASVSATTCTRCRRAPASGTKTNGAPRLTCAKCRAYANAHRRSRQRDPIYGRVCGWCAGGIDPGRPSNTQFCSIKCLQAKGNNDLRIPCRGGCGGLVIPHKAFPEPTCYTCRASARGCLTPEVVPVGKCACEGCMQARRDSTRASKLKYRESHGESQITTWHRENSYNRFQPSPEHRLSLYERDNWMCGICYEPTSRTWTAMDPLSPTLDHIEPQSAVLVPDHSDTNLRLTHAICNMMRSNRMEPDTVIAERVRGRRQFQETRSLNPLT